MANNNLRNTIPSTLEECVEPGYTATKLHRWSERIEALGRIVFWILVVVGSIHTIAITAVNAEINEEMAASTAISTIVMWLIIVVVEYAICKISALSIDAMAVIAHNTMVSANVAVLEYKKANPSKPVEVAKRNKSSVVSSVINNDNLETIGWICTCGRENAADASICSCGKSARDIQMKI